MFIGEYHHTFDTKNRISFPAKFRKDFGRSVIVTRGLDRCLFVYTKLAWKNEASIIARYANGSSAGRAYARLMLTGAMEVDVDSAGRILIPDYLRTYASLRSKTVIAGVNDRVEIWEERSWNTYTKTIERDADTFAETLNTASRA